VKEKSLSFNSPWAYLLSDHRQAKVMRLKASAKAQYQNKVKSTSPKDCFRDRKPPSFYLSRYVVQ